jgi:hypothetical protein
MSQTATTDTQELVGEPALDENGFEIGEILGIYLQNGTRQPEWAAVEVTDGELALVPLVGATPTIDGVWLPVGVEEVLGAPVRHAELPRQVSDDEATTLYRHYGGGGRQRRTNGANGADGTGRARGRRRSTRESAPPEEGPARAAEEGRRVASSATEHGEHVASTATEEGQRVASTAVQEGQQVARTAAGQATELAGTAREQVAQVRTELSDQARTLIHDTRTGIQEQAGTQTQVLADCVRRLGDEARALAEGRPDHAGALGEYVSQAAERLTNVAAEIEARGPEGLVDELKTFARTRPGTFVLGAAVVGFGIGRLLRSAGEAGDGEGETTSAATPTLASGRGVR